MELVKILILGLVQGLTEFLPVSSSGHLVLIGHFMKVKGGEADAVLEVMLHAGTLVAILAYYSRTIVSLVAGVCRREAEAWRYLGAIVVGTIPAVVVYVLAGDSVEAMFGRPRIVAGMLCVTGLILLSMRFEPKKTVALSVPAGLWIGVAQAFAMIPGISRSGSTVACARRLGVPAEKAAEFSLLMVVPLLVGASLVKAIQLLEHGFGPYHPAHLAGGMLVAGLAGYVSIFLLVKTLISRKFWMFGVYCLVAGLVAYAMLALGF